MDCMETNIPEKIWNCLEMYLRKYGLHLTVPEKRLSCMKMYVRNSDLHATVALRNMDLYQNVLEKILHCIKTLKWLGPFSGVVNLPILSPSSIRVIS